MRIKISGSTHANTAQYTSVQRDELGVSQELVEDTWRSWCNASWALDDLTYTTMKELHDKGALPSLVQQEVAYALQHSGDLHPHQLAKSFFTRQSRDYQQAVAIKKEFDSTFLLMVNHIDEQAPSSTLVHTTSILAQNLAEMWRVTQQSQMGI